MTSTLVPARREERPRRLLADLDRRSDAFAYLPPNWFASVMGTGIVAVAAATLPVPVPGLRGFALVVWALAAALLAVLLTATAVHWVRHPATARGHLGHPVTGHFYGAPAMALLTVGAGTLVVGHDVLGPHAALAVDVVLWSLGTAGGLLTSVLVPYRQFARARATRADAFGGWLMPVVPPMVSASTGALLVPHAPAGGARVALLLSCYAMFALALAASVVVIGLVVLRLGRHGAGPARGVPLYWIVLGPLGQSVTAANLLGGVAGETLPGRGAAALRAFGIGFGVPVLAAALAWAAVAAVLTARARPPFSLAWWSFTFPVGTCVTAASGLAVHTGVDALRGLAAGGFVLLVLAWCVVAGRTTRDTARGRLLRPAS